jgi:Flp pilus assembly protein TadG
MASDHLYLKPRPVLQRLRSLAKDTEGAALIEFTLFMPVLVLMAVAIIDFGLYFVYRIQVENAAQAGAQWAIINAVNNGYASQTPTNITNAATLANNSSVPSVFSSISVTSSPLCGSSFCCACPSSLTNNNPAPQTWTSLCATTQLGGGATNYHCSDGSNPGTYIQVTASGTFTPFVNFGSFLPASYPVSSTATVRVQ